MLRLGSSLALALVLPLVACGGTVDESATDASHDVVDTSETKTESDAGTKPDSPAVADTRIDTAVHDDTSTDGSVEPRCAPIGDSSGIRTCPSDVGACKTCLNAKCKSGMDECAVSGACMDYFGETMACMNDGHMLPGALILCRAASCWTECSGKPVDCGP